VKLGGAKRANLMFDFTIATDNFWRAFFFDLRVFIKEQPQREE